MSGTDEAQPRPPTPAGNDSRSHRFFKRISPILSITCLSSYPAGPATGSYTRGEETLERSHQRWEGNPVRVRHIQITPPGHLANPEGVI